MTPDPGTED